MGLKKNNKKVFLKTIFENNIMIHGLKSKSENILFNSFKLLQKTSLKNYKLINILFLINNMPLLYLKKLKKKKKKIKIIIKNKKIKKKKKNVSFKKIYLEKIVPSTNCSASVVDRACLQSNINSHVLPVSIHGASDNGLSLSLRIDSHNSDNT